MAKTQTKTNDFPANADKVTDWIVNDLNYNQSFNLSSIMINWHGLEGTLNGTIIPEITNNVNDPDFVTQLDTITLDSASNLTSNVFLDINLRIQAYRLRYAHVGITGSGVIKHSASMEV